ncbi:hypothetical protein WBJ53_14985 [Spirosoma sp. SC4-14]|uniref:hypothetical protein n=1 Tax=Spirosoma sp. SC4-14 TaxID=3128900 RepID=UPI0030D397B7
MAAEQEDEVLLKVRVDEANSEKKLAELTLQKKQLKDARDDLTKSYKEAKITEQQYADSLSKLVLQEKAVNSAIADEQKTLRNVAKVREEANGSLNQMRANLSLAVESYDALSEAERKNEEVGGKLKKQIKELSDALKEEEEATGRSYRSVGDYLKLVRVGGTSVGEFQEAVKGGVEGVQVFTKALFTGRGALIALTAVPIVAILTGLYLILTKSQAGMDKLAQYTKAAELALSALTDGIIKNTRIILEAFTSWEKFKNLWGDLRKTADETGEAMANAARIGLEVAKTNQQIEDSEIKLSVVRAKNRAEIEKYKKISEDTTKSTLARSAAAKKAYELENSTLDQSLKLQKQRIDNLKREQSVGNRTREDARKLAEEQIKYEELREESLGRQTELQNQLNSIDQEGITKAREARALANEEAIAEAERALIMAKKRGMDTLAFEEEIIRRRAKADKDSLVTQNATAAQVAQQRKLIEAKTNAEIAALRVTHLADLQSKEVSAKQAEISAALTLTRRGSKQELDLQIEAIRAEVRARQIENKKQKDQQLITELQYQEQEANIVTTGQRAIDDARNQFEQNEINRQAELSKLRIQTELNLSKDVLAIRRNEAVSVIDIEEKQQIDLLNLQDVSEEERLVRLNAIQSEAEVKRKEVYRQIQADERANRKAIIEIQLAGVNEGSLQELRLKKQLMKVQMEEELANTELTEKQKEAIRAKYRQQEKKLDEDFGKELAQQIVQTAGIAADGLSTWYEAQAQAATNALNKQQEAALKSAGTNADLRARIEEKYQNKLDEINKEAARKKKRIASIQNIIDTASAGTASLELVAKNPVLGALTELLILAKAAANQKLIDAQQFAFGGIYESDGYGAFLRGPGTGKSDSINSRLSNGESVINAVSTSMYYDELSAINVKGGGRPFPGASDVEMPQITNFSLGGVARPTTDLDRIVDAIRDIEPVVSVEEIDRVKGNKVKAVEASNY